MAKGTAPQRKANTAAVFEQDSDGSDAGSLQLESGSEMGSDLEGSDEGLEEEPSEEEEEEEERPKYAQFMDDSDLEEDSGDSQEDDELDSPEDAHSSDNESDDDERNDLQEQMRQIPFSALMKARQQMADSDDEEQDFSEPDISDLEEDEFAQDRQRLAQAKAGKQPLRNGHTKASAPAIDEALEQKRREVRERLRQLSGAPSTSSSEANDAWAESRKQREQRRNASNQRKELVKRANKNAPTEVSSKRPVSRRRNVVETASSQTRDPRFESLSGSVNKDLFAKSYSFLPEMFKDELTTLKKTLAKLKKQESTQAGPKAKSEQALAIREERAKVEAALRRAEGLAGERERRARESAVKGKIKAQNKERVEKGLQPFYPKKSEVKQMLLKDKYDRLAGGGDEAGKRVKGEEKKQLKKALERRRRKNAQKEKRSMPAGIGFGGGGVPKRKREGAAAGESGKRARF